MAEIEACHTARERGQCHFPKGQRASNGTQGQQVVGNENQVVGGCESDRKPYLGERNFTQVAANFLQMVMVKLAMQGP